MQPKPSLKSALLLLLLLLMVSPVMVPPVFAVELLGNWIYRESGSDDPDQKTQSEFQQRYQLGVGPAVTYQLTPAITASGGVGYRNTQRDTGDGMETVEQVSPFGQISLVNDIFVASASANSFTTMAGSDNSSAYWNASLNSAWDIPFWPTLQLNYGEDYSGVNNKSLFDDSNGKNQNTTVSVDWDLLLANLYYEYSINEFVDGSGASQSKVTTHYGRFNTDGRFWQNRIGYNLTQQYRESTTDIGVDDSAEDTGSGLSLRVEGVTQSFVSPTATAPDPEFDPDEVNADLANNSQLSDGNFDETAETVSPVSSGYFGFNTGSSELIDTLSLTLDSLTLLNSAQANAMQWALYYRNPNFTWTLVTASVPFFYDDDEKRFELDVSVGELESVGQPQIMVVVNNTSGVNLNFTELEAFRFFTGDSTAVGTYYQTNIGASFRPFKTLSTSFSFNYEHYDDESGGETVREDDGLTWSGRMSWTQFSYLTPSIGYSESRLERTGQPDNMNRTYSATVSTRPLPSLNVSFGYTHNDVYLDKDKTYNADTYSVSAKASIYPDLSVSLSNSYLVSDRLTADPESNPDDPESSNGEFFVNNKTLNSRLDISANLHRYLTAYAEVDYTTRDNELTGNKESARATGSLNYRPSDILSLTSSYDAYFLDNENSNAFSASMELYLLRTYKSRLSFYASHTQADETFDNFRMIGNWDISDYFSFTGNGSYSMAPEQNTYAFYLSLALRL